MTWIKHWQRHFIILWYNSAFITQIYILYYNEHNRRYVLHHGRFPLLQPRKGLTNTCIQYRWDRIAWCGVGVTFQHEGSTPRFISLYHIMTPYKSVGGDRTTWNDHSELFHYKWHLCHRYHRFPWPAEDIMQLKTRASGVMSSYNRISPHGSE